MDRDDIKNVVLKYLARAVDEIDPETVDTSLSMKDLGASSLDIVEVVSSTMREIRVKVPRAELNKLTNVDALVDLLHRRALAKAEASPPAR